MDQIKKSWIHRNPILIAVFFFLLAMFAFLIGGCQSYNVVEYYPVEGNPSTVGDAPKIYGSVKKEYKQSGYRDSDLGKSITIKGSAM